MSAFHILKVHPYLGVESRDKYPNFWSFNKIECTDIINAKYL